MDDNLPIDEVSMASPDMAPKQQAELVRSIRTLGQLVPIVRYKGTIIDGRKRLVACRELGIEPVVIDLPENGSPAEYAEGFNLIRTHYNASQRAMFAAKLSNIRQGGNRFGKKDSAVIAESPLAQIRAQGKKNEKEAARIMGVGRTMVSEAKQLRREGIPELAQAVEQGKISLHAAQYIRRNFPKDEQAAKLAQVIAAPKQDTATGRRVPQGTVKAGPTHRALPKRDPVLVVGRVLTALEQNAEILVAYMDKITQPWPEEWLPKARLTFNAVRNFVAKAKEQ